MRGKSLSNETRVAHELMGSPLFALVILRGGLIDSVTIDYSLDKLIAAGSKENLFEGDGDAAVIWEQTAIDAAQVWHYERGNADA